MPQRCQAVLITVQKDKISANVFSEWQAIVTQSRWQTIPHNGSVECETD